MIRTFFCAIACLAMASVGTAHAGIVFDFLNEDTELGGLLDGNSSGMITIGGLTITVTANPGDFNGTSSNFGINQAAGGDDTDGFDNAQAGGPGVAEGFTFSFDQDVNLMTFDVSSFSATDMIDISSGGVPIVTVDSTGSTSLGNTFIAAGTNIDVITTGGTYGNGWSLDLSLIHI